MGVFCMSNDDFNLSEFDYIMSAVAEYSMDRKLDKEMFWNIINHVEDGYEFLLAMEAQSWLMEVVENHNIMSKYNRQKMNE
jgi:hypothetical protein